MGRLGDKSDYESIREARISENKARMEMLGLLRCARELSAIATSPAHRAGSITPRKTPKPSRVLTPLRCSGSLIAATTPAGSGPSRRCSPQLNGGSVEHKALPYRAPLYRPRRGHGQRCFSVLPVAVAADNSGRSVVRVWWSLSWSISPRQPFERQRGCDANCQVLASGRCPASLRLRHPQAARSWCALDQTAWPSEPPSRHAPSKRREL